SGAFGELPVESLNMLLPVFALGDVADRARDQRSLLGLQGTEADFHGEFGAILSPSVQLETLTHRPHPRLRKELRAVLRMQGTKPLRHQGLNLLPQKLFPRVAKQPLHLGVDQY